MLNNLVAAITPTNRVTLIELESVLPKDQLVPSGFISILVHLLIVYLNINRVTKITDFVIFYYSVQIRLKYDRQTVTKL